MRDVFDRPVIGRCQFHKIRNVRDKLPEKLRTVVTARMRRAYHAESALAAEAELAALAAELDKTHAGAVASLREVWPRPSPCCGSECHPRWRARSARPTPSSR